MFDRKQYMNKECDHHTYYSQFVNPSIKSIIESAIGIKRLINSTDQEYFNDIPLAKWDSLHCYIRMYDQKLKNKSLSDCVCIAKAAARILLEEYKNV